MKLNSERRRRRSKPRCEKKAKLDLQETPCEAGLYSDRSGQIPFVGCCDHGHGLWDPTKGQQFLDQLSDYQLFKGSSLPLS